MTMKRLTILTLSTLALVATVSAQWKTTTDNLKGGWNAIYLHGDATYATPGDIFNSGDGLNIEQIWRWNPNPTQVQFTANPLIPSAGTPEWNIWYRTPGAGETTTLSSMVGQSAYLV